MKKLLILLVILGAGYFAYTRYSAGGSSVYSIKDVPVNPVPKAELVLLWKETALKMCADAPAKFGVPVDKCRQGVEARSVQCGVSASAGIPDIVGDHATSSRLGKPYLSCVLPGVMCNGVEVRTEEEARAANCG